VQRGVVLLGGEVDAAWKVSELGRVLSSMSGVDEVATFGVRVAVSGIPDRAIARSVRSTLKHAANLEERTFQARVSNGRVVLTGTALNRRELDRVVGLIEQVSGVRSVENLAVISRSAKSRDRIVAKALSRLLQNQFPRAGVDVSVFGRVTVLSGKARDPGERRAIESLVTSHPRVDRVVNKIG
jgi:osmotically-inducible protein OsmY